MSDINKPPTLEEWEEMTLSPSPEVRRRALREIHRDGFTKGLMLPIGIAFVLWVLLSEDWHW